MLDNAHDDTFQKDKLDLIGTNIKRRFLMTKRFLKMNFNSRKLFAPFTLRLASVQRRDLNARSFS